MQGGWQSRIERCEEIEPPRRQERQGGEERRGPCDRSARFLGLSSALSWRPWRLGGSLAAIRSGHHPAIHHGPIRTYCSNMREMHQFAAFGLRLVCFTHPAL